MDEKRTPKKVKPVVAKPAGTVKGTRKIIKNSKKDHTKEMTTTKKWLFDFLTCFI